jgi:hypothetical protein
VSSGPTSTAYIGTTSLSKGSSARKSQPVAAQDRKNDVVRLSAGKPVPGLGRLWSLAHRRTLGSTNFLGSPAEPSSVDTAELEAMLAAIDADKRDFALRLSSRLHPLVQRGVPPRAIEAAPARRAARLRFADGTTVLVKVAAPGDLGALAITMRHGSLKPAGCTTDADGTAHLVLICADEHRWLSLHVVGLDQPD